MFRRLSSAFLLSLAVHPAFAIQIDSVLLPEGAAKAAAPRALRLAETASIQPLAVLRPANQGAADQLDAIAAWNRSGAVPAKNGFARPLPLPRAVRFTPDLLALQPARLAGGALLVPPSGGLVWGAEVRVAGAHRLRLHLADVRLPPGTQLWVYSEDGQEEVPFAADAMTADGGIWTPSVAGPAVRFEVRLPEGAVAGSGFTIDRVLELFALDADGTPRLDAGGAPAKADTSCLQDAACFGDSALAGMEVYKRAVARLQFVEGGEGFLCSGGLLNDTDNSTTIPYLLTAHHCIGTQAVAATLEAVFDYIAASCGGSAPSIATLPRTEGATLLATGSGSDFTLLQLSSLPPGRGLLGSTNEPVANGTVLHRLSHPLALPQHYSVTTLAASGPTCQGLPRPNFLYSVRQLGGILGGSSGSPVVRGSDGRVVGELLGTCGPIPSEGCSNANYVVDGALAVTWPSIAPWLVPATPGSCIPGPATLCLGANGRFKVEATFDTGALQGQAQVVKLTEETGYLWFFDAANVETVVKVLDGCSLNQRYWVFAGGLTNVHTEITVTDTATGAVKKYTNPAGPPFQPIQDVNAFATCP